MPRRMLVSVVDDDESVREALPDLLRELGFSVQAFSSAEAFLESGYVEQTKCLVLDVSMPGMSGPDLRRELMRCGQEIPTIFITAHAEVALPPDVLRGAVACLIKPFSEAALEHGLKEALKKT